MGILISNSLSPMPLDATNSSSNSQPAQNTQPTTNESADTVKLTESQQVVQLYQQGQKVSQIASSLSLTEAAVNSYLGISNQ